MNEYDFWRFIGSSGDLPETIYHHRPADFFQNLKKKAVAKPADGNSLNTLLVFAWRFSRLDELKLDFNDEKWSLTSSGILNRGRIRLYRILAEDLRNPDHEMWAAAKLDFQRAAEDSHNAVAAIAGLIRLYGIAGKIHTATKHLRQLYCSRQAQCRPAAAGAALFLADLPGSSPSIRTQFLETALRFFQDRDGEDATLMRARIALRLARTAVAYRILKRLNGNGNLDARYELLTADITVYQKTGVGNLNALLERIRSYRNARPFDPQGFIAEGDLLLSQNSEAARLAWRSALAIDDHNAEAWSRLGSLFRDNAKQENDSCNIIGLETARNIFIRAATLEPLNSHFKLMIGLIERDYGRSDQAIALIDNALAINRWNLNMRRWLALSWLDLACNTQLSQSSRHMASEYSRTEWLNAHHSMESIQATALEGGDGLEEWIQCLLCLRLPPHTFKPSKGMAHIREIEKFLLTAEAVSPWDSRIQRYRAGLMELYCPEKAIQGYLSAAAMPETDENNAVRWIIRASEIADSLEGEVFCAQTILQNALNRFPGMIILVLRLIPFLVDSGKYLQAVDVYKQTIAHHPENRDFFAESLRRIRSWGYPEVAEEIISKAIDRDPENPWLWNQLSMHYLELGSKLSRDS